VTLASALANGRETLRSCVAYGTGPGEALNKESNPVAGKVWRIVKHGEELSQSLAFVTISGAAALYDATAFSRTKYVRACF
jgi:hypothetical protein